MERPNKRTRDEEHDPLIPFGRHKLKRISQLPFQYLTWLAGYAISNNEKGKPFVMIGEVDWINEKAHSIFDAAEAGMGCGCREAPQKHHKLCERTVCGGSYTHTKQRLLERLAERNVEFVIDLRGLKAWYWAYLNHRDVVEAARAWISQQKLCLHCGKRMPSVGSARRNGAGHDDWEDRKLHKSCWRNLLQDADRSNDEDE